MTIIIKKRESSMRIDDLFAQKDAHIAVDEVRENSLNQTGVSKYEEILSHPLMSKLERFDDWEQEQIDAGYKHMFEMRIGSARAHLYQKACEDMIFHHYIQAFLDIVDLLRSQHSSVFISASYEFPNFNVRVRLDPEKYTDKRSMTFGELVSGIVPSNYTMRLFVCIKFGKYVSEWFRMLNRLWNAYNNEYNDLYSIGIWDHLVWIYSGNNVSRAQRHYKKCETVSSMNNFGGNMCHIATLFEKKRQQAFSPSLCECMTKGCQKYMIFDLSPLEVKEKIKKFMLRYGEDTGIDPYNNEWTHSCMYY